MSLTWHSLRAWWASFGRGELLLNAATAERVSTSDFGLGDNAFKHRFATHERCGHAWGLYPAASAIWLGTTPGEA